MRPVLIFLLFLNLIIPLLCIRGFCISKRGIEVDHILLFSLGFLFYWVFPIISGIMQYGDNLETLIPWFQRFNQISDTNLTIYVLSSLCCYISFIYGSFFCKRFIVNDNSNYKILPFNTKILDIYLLLFTIITICYGYSLKNVFFSGYVLSAWHSWKGSFTASTLVLLSLLFIYTEKIRETCSHAVEFWRIILNRYFFIYGMFAILLLSLGGKTFFISFILMLFIYRSVYFKPLKVRSFFIFIVILIPLATIFTIARTGHSIMGNTENFWGLVSIDQLIFIFLSDSLFTSFALIHFLLQNTIPFINYPFFLLSEFSGLIPTILFPEKGILILDPNKYGYEIFSPYGALNSFFTLMINFGIVGTIVVFFLVSFILYFLKMSPHAHPFRTIYIMISGWLAVSFFKDFNATTVKLVFEFSTLVPILIIFSAHLLSVLAISDNKRSKVFLP